MKLKDACFSPNESYDKLRQIIQKQRHHVADKGPYSQSYGRVQCLHGHERYTINEGWVPKNWCFRTVVQEKTLWESLDWTKDWSARRSNQSILKEISPEYSLEGLMLRLKLQYLGHLMRRANSLEKTLMLGKIEGRRRRGDRGWDGWMASLIQWTWVWANSGE